MAKRWLFNPYEPIVTTPNRFVNAASLRRVPWRSPRTNGLRRGTTAAMEVRQSLESLTMKNFGVMIIINHELTIMYYH